MHITIKGATLPQAGDTVSYCGKAWEVVAYEFSSDDLTIKSAADTRTIKRIDID